MKANFIQVIAAGMTAFFGVSHCANACQNFSSQFKNMSDGAKPTVTIAQRGCDEITMIDNAGIVWPLHLDGRRTPMPQSVSTVFPDVLTEAHYTAAWSDSDKRTLNLSARARLSLKSDVNRHNTLTTELEYRGIAGVIYRANGKKEVSLKTESLRLISVDQNGVEKGEVSGFIQGANFVLGYLKSALNALLVN